jgi:hypothetical protein
MKCPQSLSIISNGSSYFECGFMGVWVQSYGVHRCICLANILGYILRKNDLDFHYAPFIK